MTTPPLPEQIELHRDRMWRRDEELRVESAVDAERFIEDVGFANADRCPSRRSIVLRKRMIEPIVFVLEPEVDWNPDQKRGA